MHIPRQNHAPYLLSSSFYLRHQYFIRANFYGDYNQLVRIHSMVTYTRINCLVTKFYSIIKIWYCSTPSGSIGQAQKNQARYNHSTVFERATLSVTKRSRACCHSAVLLWACHLDNKFKLYTTRFATPKVLLYVHQHLFVGTGLIPKEKDLHPRALPSFDWHLQFCSHSRATIRQWEACVDARCIWNAPKRAQPAALNSESVMCLFSEWNDNEIWATYLLWAIR